MEPTWVDIKLNVVFVDLDVFLFVDTFSSTQKSNDLSILFQ